MQKPAPTTGNPYNKCVRIEFQLYFLLIGGFLFLSHFLCVCVLCVLFCLVLFYLVLCFVICLFCFCLFCVCACVRACVVFFFKE